MIKMKTYRVRFVKEYDVEATDKVEAINKAEDKFAKEWAELNIPDVRDVMRIIIGEPEEDT